MGKLKSTFNGSAEGWTATDNGNIARDPAFFWVAENGVIRGREGAVPFYFEGGAIWTGDLSDNYGGTLSYHIGTDTTFIAPKRASTRDIVIKANDGAEISYHFDDYPTKSFSTFKVSLDAYSGWITETGRLATQTEIRDVLADVASFQILGAYSSFLDPFTETTELNQVVLTVGHQPRTQPVAIDRADLIGSNFEKGGEGWSFDGSGTTLLHLSDRGYRSDGSLEIVNVQTTSSSYPKSYFSAPEAYLGDLGAFFGGKLSYALHNDTLRLSVYYSSGMDVIIVGADGKAVGRLLDDPSEERWTDYETHLDMSAPWVLTDANGVTRSGLATEADLRAILSEVTAIKIAADYSQGVGVFTSGDDTTVLDTVRLAAPDGAFDILASSKRLDLVATADTMEEALALLKNGNVLRLEERHNVNFDLDKSVTIIGDNKDGSGPKLVSAVFLGDGGHTVTIRNPGLNLEVNGGAGNDRIKVANVGDEIVVRGGGGRDRLTAETESSVRASLYGDKGRDTLVGGDGNDALFGGGRDDRLLGGNGRDDLKGGGGADVFVFRPDGVYNTIRDFRPGTDVIELRGFAGINDFADLKPNFEQTGGSVLLDIDGTEILLRGIERPKQLSADDFDFA